MSRTIQGTLTLGLRLAAVLGVMIFNASPLWSQCDLEVKFIAPAGSTLPGGQAVTWTLRFTNIGNAECPGNKIKLSRYSGGTASGYGTVIGGSGNLVALPALGAHQSVDLNFVENTPPNTGTFTYKATYSAKHNDADNKNHHPTKTVTYQAAPAPTGPADLVVDSATFTQGPAVGTCNTVKITVRNQGGLANQITRATLVAFPTGNPFQNRFEKHVFLSAFLAGQTRTADLTGVNLATAGSWTIQVVADSQQQVAEANENNNTLTQDNISVTQNCQ